MKNKIEDIKKTVSESVINCTSLKEIEALKVQFLGKKGEINALMRFLSDLPKEEKPLFGAEINKLRDFVESEINKVSSIFELKEENARFENERIDLTLPGRTPLMGHKHPLRIIMDQIEDVFLGMGFVIEEGPEIDTDHNNFKALNFQDDHPARDSQDTLYINEKTLLRTHTSPVQHRTMLKMAPEPIRAIMPGRVFRRDDIDATHSPQFHQVEGLVVDKNIAFSDLIGTLKLFAKTMFGDDREIRLRPSFFPFTEPSVEIDVSCIMCGGKGCSFCKRTGWLEILGAGAVHPNVLKMGGYDPEVYSGFAFGMGVERIALLKYRIPDIRHLFENDVRFLKQFK